MTHKISPRTVHLILFILMSPSIFSQTSEKVVIERLNFSYKKGNHFHYTGTNTFYNYDKPDPVTGAAEELNTNSELYYYIDNEEVDEGDTIVNFNIMQIDGEDTMTINYSPLMITDSGMYFWINFSKEDISSKSLAKLKKKYAGYRFNTIKTPLHFDDEWEQLDYSYKKSLYFCITTDTVITTGIGDLHAFGIASKSIYREEKGYKIYTQIVEYYSQGIGKIQMETFTYVVIDGGNEEIPVLYNLITLSEWWRDGDQTHKN